MAAAYCAACVGMDFYMACVDHEPFIVGIIYKSLKYSFPNSFVPPPAETSVDVVPAAIFRRQITSWRSGPQYPEYGIDKLSIVAYIAAPCPLPARKERFQQAPYFIADIVSVVIFRHSFRFHSAFSIIINLLSILSSSLCLIICKKG